MMAINDFKVIKGCEANALHHLMMGSEVLSISLMRKIGEYLSKSKP